jgi:hypothetical protein
MVLNCLNYLEGQEGQLPNIRTMLATILTVPRHLRAQPTGCTSLYDIANRRGRGEQLLGHKAVLVLFWLTQSRYNDPLGRDYRDAEC